MLLFFDLTRSLSLFTVACSGLNSALDELCSGNRVSRPLFNSDGVLLVDPITYLDQQIEGGTKAVIQEIHCELQEVDQTSDTIHTTVLSGPATLIRSSLHPSSFIIRLGESASKEQSNSGICGYVLDDQHPRSYDDDLQILDVKHDKNNNTDTPIDFDSGSHFNQYFHIYFQLHHHRPNGEPVFVLYRLYHATSTQWHQPLCWGYGAVRQLQARSNWKLKQIAYFRIVLRSPPKEGTGAVTCSCPAPDDLPYPIQQRIAGQLWDMSKELQGEPLSSTIINHHPSMKISH